MDLRARRPPVCRADAYAGFNDLYAAGRRPTPLIEAGCWAHARRNFFKLTELTKAPLAVEAVRRIDAIFAVERDISGQAAEQRLAVRGQRVASLVEELKHWMDVTRTRMSHHADAAKAIDYMLRRWAAFTRFLTDGHICLTNNAAERALRGIALGRKSWLFAGAPTAAENVPRQCIR